MEDNLIFSQNVSENYKNGSCFSPIVLTTFEVIKLSPDSFFAVSKKSQFDSRSTKSYEYLKKMDKMFVYQL